VIPHHGDSRLYCLDLLVDLSSKLRLECVVEEVFYSHTQGHEIGFCVCGRCA
jgi:hypothetical protein